MQAGTHYPKVLLPQAHSGTTLSTPIIILIIHYLRSPGATHQGDKGGRSATAESCNPVSTSEPTPETIARSSS